MKNQRGVCAVGWGEPCSALRNATVGSTNRDNALGRGESSPQLAAGFFLKRLIYRYLSRSKKTRYLELALVALAEIPEADAEGGFL